MEKLLFKIVALILVPACSGQSPSCDDYPCPQYQVIETNQDFEVRRYADTNWITTSMSSRDASSLMAAANTLRTFCDTQKKAGHEIFDGWPALITVEEGDAPSTSLSWFLGPGSKPGITDTSVTQEHKAAFTVYVRSYGGTPSLSAAENNKKTLLEALAKAGKGFKPNVTIGAHYEAYYALNHHNEIWVYSA